MAAAPDGFDTWSGGAPAVAPDAGLGDLSLWADGAPVAFHTRGAETTAFWAFAQRPPLAAHGPLGLQRTG